MNLKFASEKKCALPACAASLAFALAVLAILPLSASWADDTEESIRSIQKRAVSKQLEGDLDGAIDTYEKACAIAKSEYGENSAVVGDLYLDMGILALDSAKQFDRAEIYLHKAAQLKDNSVTAHLKLAELLALRGTSEKNAQARREIEKALVKNPRSQPARQALAMFYQKQGQPMRALHQYSYLNQVINGKAIPRDKFSHARVVPYVKPKDEPIAIPVYKAPAPPVYAKPIPVVRPVVKPRPKPVYVAPKPKAKPVAQPVMRALQPISEPRPSRSKPVKSKNGLVPPPPPVMPMFGGGFAPPPQPGVGSPAFNLKTEAQIKSKSKSKPVEPADEKPVEKPRANPTSDSPDFLLDWASERKKK